MAATADWAYSAIPAPQVQYPHPRHPAHSYVPAPFQHLATQRPLSHFASRISHSPPKKILHIIGTLGAGGAELQLCHTVIGLAKRGYQVRVATLDALVGPAAFRLGTLQDAGIAVTAAGATCNAATRAAIAQLPDIAPILHECPKWLRPMAVDLLGEMLSDPPELVHAWLDWANIAAAVAALAARIPRIVLATRSVNPTHLLDANSPRYHPWYQFLATVPGITWINNSHAGALDYAHWLALDAQRFHVIRNGVDMTALPHTTPAACQAFRQTLGITHGPIVAGVFRLGPEKQPMLFLDVAEIVMHHITDLHAVIVGSGPLEQALQARVQSSPFASRIHLLGTRSDVPMILSAADLLLQTSRIEGTPNTLLEAQALGCPVVTTAAAGAIEAVCPDQTAFVSHRCTAEELAEQVTTLLTAPDLRRRFAAAGPKFIQDHFGLARMINETETLYASPS